MIKDTREKISSKRNEISILESGLYDSMRIESLWPGCFDYGKVRTFVVGDRRSGYSWCIRRGDGEIMAFDVETIELPLGRKYDYPSYILKSDIIPFDLVNRGFPPGMIEQARDIIGMG